MSARTSPEADRETLERTKVAILAEGMAADPLVLRRLSDRLGGPLTLHEYPTTGGLTLELDQGVFVNAPFDEWYCRDASVALVEGADGSLSLASDVGVCDVRRVLPLPGYIGRPEVESIVMSHADRVRVSPISGCAFDCGFCDLGALQYERKGEPRVLAALDAALADKVLPARHVLISGGSPRARHDEWFLEQCETITRHSTVPVDVMFAPMPRAASAVDRLVDAGVQGVSINIELFSGTAGREVLGSKYRSTRTAFEATAERAVELLGRSGAVRSLIIPGLEPAKETLRGVEYLASLGVSPVLSPFRPSAGTRLASEAPPAKEMLAEILGESREIVHRFGLELGPHCGPCQHNTLTFPWDVSVPPSL